MPRYREDLVPVIDFFVLTFFSGTVDVQTQSFKFSEVSSGRGHVVHGNVLVCICALIISHSMPISNSDIAINEIISKSIPQDSMDRYRRRELDVSEHWNGISRWNLIDRFQAIDENAWCRE